MVWFRPALLAAAAAVVACGGGYATGSSLPKAYPPDPGTPPAPVATVTVNDDYYSPNSVVLSAGGTVTFSWMGGNGHSVTPAGTPTFSPTSLVSYPPKQMAVTFATMGNYDFYCTVHGTNTYGGAGAMTGTIFVR
jgi:plastocyanin